MDSVGGTMRRNNKVIGFAMTLLLLAAPSLWLFDLIPIFPGITVYPVYCGKDLGDHGPCINLPPITYQASTDRQEVEYRPDTGAPTTLTDCTVHDRRNWECWYKNRSGRLSMTDSEFRDEIRNAALNQDVFDSVRYVPKWKWWAVKIGIHTDG
ncbi:hypothetical protein HZA56_01095 [Candidatus Poribacteria bacterium]|nr:hypothetical protein [Candidatus Poribacteria bacterium]